MIDWTQSMKQTYEFYIVDPNTWMDLAKLDEIISASVDWDISSETLCSAKIKSTTLLNECYIRIYLVVEQNDEILKTPLATVLVQTPNVNYNGKHNEYDIEAYSPLLELKDKFPPIGYTVPKNIEIMNKVGSIMSENMRAPVVITDSDYKLNKNFTSELNESWLSYISSLCSEAKHSLSMDGLGKVMFEPEKRFDSLTPIFTFNDDNSSILLPDISIDRDLYGIPNVVELVLQTNNGYLYSRVENDDISSPISTINRGREVVHRETEVSLPGTPNQEQLDAYANMLLSNLSSLEYTVTFKHGYYPVRIGDCVYLNYERANLKYVKAMIISQSIECVSGCIIIEKALYRETLWRG